MRYVVKIGGHSLDDLSADNSVLPALTSEIKGLVEFGHEVCVVHGGGPQIDGLLKLSGLGSEFIEGLRVTSPATIATIQMALSSVNATLVSHLNASGVPAVGLRGFDGDQGLSVAIGEPWGMVATDVKFNPRLIQTLWSEKFTPVLSPVVSDGNGGLLNCNADGFAGAIAQSVSADALLLLSDIDQIRSDASDSSSGLATVTFDELKQMIEDGTVSDGMVPKAKAAIAAGSQGAARVLIANAASPFVITRALANQIPTTEVIP